MRYKDFSIDGEIEYNGMTYKIFDIIYEAVVYGCSYRLGFSRDNPYAWILKRKQLYTKEFLMDVFKTRYVCEQICKLYSKAYLYNKKHNAENARNFSINKQLIKNNIFNKNTILEQSYIESLISKEIYKKYMCEEKIILPQKRILRKQNLIYNTILPENHYRYEQYYKSNFIDYNVDLYRELADLMGYFVPEGENAKEFCYLLLGENEAESFLKELTEPSKKAYSTNSISLYGKFKDLKGRKR